MTASAWSTSCALQTNAHEAQGMEKQDINADNDADATWQQLVQSLHFFSIVQLLTILKHVSPVLSAMHDIKVFYISEIMTHLRFCHRILDWCQSLFMVHESPKSS